jgi:flagellar export protein FliJ
VEISFSSTPVSKQRSEVSSLRAAADYVGMSGPSFRFRLERVRALRERGEDAAKLELAGALALHQECEAAVAAAEERIALARAAQLQPGSAVDLMARQAYLERTEHVHRATCEDLHRQERKVAARREELTVAARDRQALERLKSHRLADFQRESARVENLMLDEIAAGTVRRRAA